MRYLNLILASSLALLPTLSGCGDDKAESEGAEASEESGTETAETTGSEAMEAEGDGDGDPTTGDGDGDPTTGDGDGDPTTGDGDGDGDPTTGDGDGDGDPTTGDGDGDPTTGDGDGDQGCTPINDTECAMCQAENCCEEIMACEANDDCSCFTDCIIEGMDAMACAQACEVNPMMIPELMALRACGMMFCMDACAMP
jgi:hypothetical protein